MELEKLFEKEIENDKELEIKIRIDDEEYPTVSETVGENHVYKSVSEVFLLLADLM